MAKTVIVLGASYGGLGVVHKLLKIAPAAVPELKVILVSPTTHLYWNLATPRAVVPNAIPDETLTKPLAPGLSRYPPERFQLIIGAASAIDTASNSVTITPASGGEGESQTQTHTYDILVIATGARCADGNMPWKSFGTYDEIISRLHGLQGRISAASHIVVAGAGPTGVETAAELGYNFAAGKPVEDPGRKQITLLSAGPQILNGDSIAAGTEKELTGVGVEVKNSSKVQETRQTAEGRTEVVLENGETLVCDVYLTTMGLRPNSEFIPEEMRTERGYLQVNDCFQARAFENVFGVGDIVSIPRAGYVMTDWQSPQVARNVELILKGQPAKAVSQLPVDVLFTSIGPKRGTGRIGFVKVPSFVVSMAKGKTMGVERVAKTIDGGSGKA